MFRRSMLGSMWRHPLATTIVLTIITIVFYAVNIPICGSVFLLYGVIFAVIWLVRLIRDQQAAERVKNQALQDAPPVMKPPIQTSRGSGTMFVPKPIDQDRQ